MLAFEESAGDFAGSLLEPNSALDPASDDSDENSFRPTPSSTRLRQISPSTSYSAPIATSRTRTTSDPFIDPSRSQGSTLVPTSSSPPDPDHLTLAESESTQFTPSSSSRPHAAWTRPRGRQRTTADFQNALSEPHYRLWTFPKFISNPELAQLCALFPSFITKRGISRFPVGSSASRSSPTTAASNNTGGRGGNDETTPRELEEGILGGATADASTSGSLSPGEIRVGTGKMRLSEQRRTGRWRGSFWERMREWFRNLFR